MNIVSALENISLNEQRWGPVELGHGKVRFQIWAPEEKLIVLSLQSGRHPMSRSDDGWHTLEIQAAAGEAYYFVLSGGKSVSDPASRLQLRDLDGPSVLVDRQSYRWKNTEWIGLPWEEAVIYETHVGTFTQEGTFSSAIERLPHLADIGVTALELMPLAHFPGRRGWGYDGVLQFAPHNVYGSPDELKAMVDAAHGHGIMVFLDVVYNHFGPEGNYLGEYAPGFFRKDRPTPWGDAIAYERPEVRDYFIENVLYWLDEFRFDGLRFDAIDQIEDGSDVHILQQIAMEVREQIKNRHVHLITENPANGTDLMQEIDGGRYYRADWNDDFHHAVHVAATCEKTGYYEPFKDHTWEKIGHILAKGYLRPGKAIFSNTPPPTEALPPTAFIHFLQNHDQVGNRALGDRLYLGIDPRVYRVLTEVLFLSPQIPMMFMGDDHLSLQPFHFFSDYKGAIADAVRANRPKEAENFGGIPAGRTPLDIPDPNDASTFDCSKLNWSDALSEGARDWHAHVKNLIGIRRNEIVPLLSGASGYAGTVVEALDGCLFVDWSLTGGTLQLRANLSHEARPLMGNLGAILYSTEPQPHTVMGPFVTHVYLRAGR